MADDYVDTSLSQLQRAWREANNALAETIHGAPDRYEQGGIGDVVFGSPAWQAYQAVAQSGLPKTVRVAKADGGELPLFAQPDNEAIANALDLAQRPRYDTGPQPGEATISTREMPLGEKVSSYLMGDQRATPWRRQVAETPTKIGQVAERVGNMLVADPYQAAGEAVGQFEAGHPVDAFATMWGAMPTTGALKGYSRAVTPQGFYSHGAEAAANLPQAKGSYEQMMKMLEKAGVRPEEMRWAGVQEALGHKPTVTQEELHKHFLERMPQLQETVHRDPYLKLVQNAEETEYAGEPMFDVIGERGNVHYTGGEPDARQYMREGVGGFYDEAREPKFSQYTLPGGENYREVLMHLPLGEQSSAELKDYTRNWLRGMGEDFDAMSAAQQREYMDSAREQSGMGKTGNAYTSSHWDTPNVVAHLRMSDRELPEGGKALHIEELQSDWAKEGQKKGFRDQRENEYSKLAEENQALAQKVKDNPDDEASWSRLTEVRNRLGDLARGDVGVPSAPFVAGGKNDWLDLSLKRALREAAEGGYDKMVWTPGEAQAARYDLSKHLDTVLYDPRDKSLIGRKDGANALVEKNVTADKLSDYVGKEVAQNLLGAPQNQYGMHELSGQDLSIGGEGMKSFYDKVVPNQLSKILKKLDPSVKVGQEAIAADKAGWHITPPNQTVSGKWMVKSSDYNSKGLQFDTEEEARAALAERIKKEPVHSIPITPKMREEIMKGLPAYASGGYVSDDDHIASALRLAK